MLVTLLVSAFLGVSDDKPLNCTICSSGDLNVCKKFNFGYAPKKLPSWSDIRLLAMAQRVPIVLIYKNKLPRETNYIINDTVWVCVSDSEFFADGLNIVRWREVGGIFNVTKAGYYFDNDDYHQVQAVKEKKQYVESQSRQYVEYQPETVYIQESEPAPARRLFRFSSGSS